MTGPGKSSEQKPLGRVLFPVLARVNSTLRAELLSILLENCKVSSARSRNHARRLSSVLAQQAVVSVWD